MIMNRPAYLTIAFLCTALVVTTMTAGCGGGGGGGGVGSLGGGGISSLQLSTPTVNPTSFLILSATDPRTVTISATVTAGSGASVASVSSSVTKPDGSADSRVTMTSQNGVYQGTYTIPYQYGTVQTGTYTMVVTVVDSQNKQVKSNAVTFVVDSGPPPPPV